MNKKAVYACALVIPIVNLSQNYNDMNKRYNFVAYDYAKNILRSAPQASVVVMKKDVQLFALWNMQYAENKRLDLKIISQGLCGSFWYQDKFKILHPKTYIEKLREHSDWKNLESFNLPYKTYFSLDAEYQLGADLNETPAGLLVELSQNKTGTADEVLLNEIYPYRGKFHYNDYKEFFTPDIIDDYSKADFRTGMSFLFAKKYEKARSFFIKAINKKHLSPQVMNFMAFSYYEQGDYQKAISAYEDAVILYRKLHDMSVEFNSMPDVKSGIVKDLSDAYISLGVCYEKTGNDERSLDSYRNSASVSGGNPKAFFNMSVIYWKHQDWQNVIRELENALRIDPNYQEARFYLEQARAKLKQ